MNSLRFNAVQWHLLVGWYVCEGDSILRSLVLDYTKLDLDSVVVIERDIYDPEERVLVMLSDKVRGVDVSYHADRREYEMEWPLYEWRDNGDSYRFTNITASPVSNIYYGIDSEAGMLAFQKQICELLLTPDHEFSAIGVRPWTFSDHSWAK